MSDLFALKYLISQSLDLAEVSAFDAVRLAAAANIGAALGSILWFFGAMALVLLLAFIWATGEVIIDAIKERNNKT